VVFIEDEPDPLLDTRCPPSHVRHCLTGDGKLDLAVLNFQDNTVSILVGNGDGTFQTRVDFPAGSLPRTIATGDFNRDGKLDLAVAHGNFLTSRGPGRWPGQSGKERQSHNLLFLL
jgi:FG-GAP-like repeat